MSAEEAARRVLNEVDLHGDGDEFAKDCRIVAQAVLDQQRVLGQVAAALGTSTTRLEILLARMRGCEVEHPGQHELSLEEGPDWVAEHRESLALPDVTEALAAWRKEQGQ